MGSGANSTLILHPKGLDDITFDLTGAAARSGGYVVSLDTLRFNEDKRLKIIYSEGANIEGGKAISSHSPLVPITFLVVIYGATLPATIQRAEALLSAITNIGGGTLEYKPDDLSASVRSTFYHYEQSLPPKPRDRWDRGAHDSGLYRMQVEVELQTQPFATSDPDSPVTVRQFVTVANQDDGVAGYATIDAANIKGTEEALVQLRIRNLVAGAWAAIQKLWYARRTEEGLANFSPILEGGTPDINSSIHWSTESDNTRRSNNFQRYAPPEAANGQWASLYYSISNITDHEGKAAIAVVCRSLAESREDWYLKAALQVADVIVEITAKNVATVGMWTVCILGELDIPPTPISDDESYATKLYLYLIRTTGDENSAIDIDFVQLLYVDEYPQQVTITDGFTDSYRLLLENFDQELCHVVDQSTLALEKVAEPLCPLLKLRPGVDNRVDFVWERLGGVYEVLADTFEDYEAWRWLKVADFESDESWYSDPLGADTTHYIEGAQGGKVTGVGGGFLDLALDLSQEGRFTDNDFVYISFYVDGSGSGIILCHFYEPGGVGRVAECAWNESWSTGWYFKKMKRSDMNVDSGFEWGDIVYVKVQNQVAAISVTFDDWRIVKADPDASTRGNDTGTIWDPMRDVWHIEEQDSTDKALGCIDNTAALEQVALIHEEPPANIKYLAKVRAKRDDAAVGLVFRCEDGTSGSEDMAAFYINTSADKLRLRKWAAGSVSDIATEVSQSTDPDTDYWLGVWMIEDRVRCYFGTSKSAIWDDENKEFVASARKFNETNAVFALGGALASGQCGLLSIGTLGRFDDVELYAVGDGHVPGDTIQVEAKAIYRSIYPFRE